MGEPFLLHVLDNDVRLEDFVQRVGPSCVHLLLRLELGQRPLRFNKPLGAPRHELVLTLRTSDFLSGGELVPSVPHLLDLLGSYSWLRPAAGQLCPKYVVRSEEHTSELQSLMRISYAVFCLKKKKKHTSKHKQH